MIRVLIVDDHPMMRQGIQNSLANFSHLNIVGTASNGFEALKKVARLQVDVVLLDIQMPDMDGITCAKELLRLHSKTKVLMLSMFQEKVIYEKLKELGVHGYLLKTSEAEEIYDAIKKIMEGKLYFRLGIDVFEKDISLPIDLPKTDQEKIKLLSKREKEILKYLSKGMSSTEIGNELHISARTVDTHRTNIMKKTAIHKVAGLIRFAFKTGIA